MRIRQIFESQRSQIEQLHRNSQVFLYHPTNIGGIRDILKDRYVKKENAFAAGRSAIHLDGL